MTKEAETVRKELEALRKEVEVLQLKAQKEGGIGSTKEEEHEG